MFLIVRGGLERGEVNHDSDGVMGLTNDMFGEGRRGKSATIGAGPHWTII